MDRKNAIGVMDSGVGGLTVVRELQRLLPGEDIIYFGDSANCPYGNQAEERIFDLSRKMLAFLGENSVKCAAIACNTISALADRLRPQFRFKIISIIEEAAGYVAREGFRTVGLMGTEFTVASGKYEEWIHKGSPACRVIGKGSPCLAGLVEHGALNPGEIDREITARMDNILSRGKIEALILGCTHYPIIEENFRRCCPGIRLINPALEQARAVERCLKEEDALNGQERGTFTVYTSGDPQAYVDVGRRLGLFEPTALRSVKI